MKHKSLALAAAAATLGLVLSGCSGTSGGGDSDGGVTKITFLSWLKNSDAVVKEFNRTHDDVKVSFKQSPGAADNYTTLANSTKAGTAPDVVTVEYPHLPDAVSQGWIQPLSDDAQAVVKKSYPESAQSLVRLGSDTWSMPLDLATWLMYYRADLFEKHHIAVPTTWAEYESAAKAIKKADPSARIGATTNADSGTIETMNWQAGSKWYGTEGDAWTVDIDNASTAKVAAMQQSLVDQHLVWTDEADVLNQKQAKGETWSVLAGSWNGAYLPVNFADQKGKWRVAAPPSWTSTPTSAGNGGATFAVSKGSDKQAAAEEFIEWMTTTKAGIEARVADGASSVLPADPDLIPVAKKVFDTSFFGGQDIYQVAEDASATIPADWTWGPAQDVMDTALMDGIAKAKTGSEPYESIFGPVQQAVVESLKSRGISVR